jgi:hypothetical protein
MAIERIEQGMPMDAALSLLALAGNLASLCIRKSFECASKRSQTRGKGAFPVNKFGSFFDWQWRQPDQFGIAHSAVEEQSARWRIGAKSLAIAGEQRVHRVDGHGIRTGLA